MSKLIVDQKTIESLFSDKKADFLIPDYQRPYAWGETECQTLWDDIFAFAIPDNDASKFNKDEEYYLGPIVTFKNRDGKQEIIDGQQRLTTMMLLLRAFYKRSSLMQDSNTRSMRKIIEQCIWKTNEFGEADTNALKIDSEVATDDDKDEFLAILKNGTASSSYKSKYAENYRFFEQKIGEFLESYPSYFPFLPIRILNNCILLPIEAENQDTALRIFSTLNDRGKPLADADIFKAEFYKFYSKQGRKDEFIERWKALEKLSVRAFTNGKGMAMDELFTRYMYYLRAYRGNTSTTTEALRKFYEQEQYSVLKNEQTLTDLEVLARFWCDIYEQNNERFSDKALRHLFVLHYAPNGMWYYFVTVYFMHNRLLNNKLDDNTFCAFLEKITAFIWAFALTNPGVNSLRTPVYREMVNIINNQTVTFSDFKFDKENFISIFKNNNFLNQRQITRSMLTWWAFQCENQALFPLSTRLDIEHIYARNRAKTEPLTSESNLDSLGNKSLLEQRINIRASDYRFSDKAKHYRGLQSNKAGTAIVELLHIAESKDNFTEQDILQRNEQIINSFVAYLGQNGLLK